MFCVQNHLGIVGGQLAIVLVGEKGVREGGREERGKGRGQKDR